MSLRTKLAALLGAGILAIGVAGVAFAYESYTASLECFPSNVVLRVSSVGLPDGTTYTYSVDGGAVQGPFAGNSGPNWLDDLYGAGSRAVAHSAHVEFQFLEKDPLAVDVSIEPCDQQPTEPPTAAPSESVAASQSFTATVEAATDIPTEPNTATAGRSNGGPTDSSWLLVAGLGVLLASVVVMTPARAKTRR